MARQDQKNMEAKLEEALKGTDLTVVRLKPQPAATHLVVKKVGSREVALPIKTYSDTGRLWQRLTSPEQAGPSVFWMKSGNVVIVPPGVIKICSMKPDRVEAMFPAATHRQEDIGSVLEDTLLSQRAGLQDVAATRLRLEPDSTRNRQDSLQYHRLMETSFAGLLEKNGMRLVRLKPHSSATHLVVRTTGREVALPMRFRVETEHLFQGLLSDEHRGPSIFWMKDQTVVFLGPADLGSNAMRPERVRSLYKSSTHRQDRIGALLERMIIAQESDLHDLQITRLRLEPDLYDRALAIREAGFPVELSDRPAVLEAVNKQLANLFPDTQSNILKALTQQDLASHTYTPNTSRPLMPLKLVVEQKQGCVALLEGKYEGLLVLWLLTGHCLLIQRSDMPVNAWTGPQVYKFHADKLVPHSNVPTALQGWYNAVWSPSGKVYSGQTVHKTISREKALEKYGNNRLLESITQAELCGLLGPRYKLTPEACTADGSFCGGNKDECMPIQVKSSRIAANNTYHFSATSGYDNMLLLCRPMPSGGHGTCVIPGYGLRSTLCLRTSSTSMYTPYLVPDRALATFIMALFSSVQDCKTTHMWPSGTVVDIRHIRLYTHEHLSTPTNAKRLIERQFSLRRNILFPDHQYTMPEVQNTPVDILIDTVRIQDKVARFHGQGHTATLKKNAGRVCGKRTSMPYTIEDFDALCLFTPDHRYLFLIPAAILAARGILRSSQTCGIGSITCYVPGEYRPLRKITADTWTSEYAIKMEEDAQSLFSSRLQAIAAASITA